MQSLFWRKGRITRTFATTLLALLWSIVWADEPPLTDCDRYVASDPSGVQTAYDIPLALKSCAAALERYPDSDRLALKLGSANEKIKNYQAALVLYRRGADRDYPPSMNALGTLYFYGFGVPLDLGQSVIWYRKAAIAGDMRGEFNLGAAYSEGKGISRDYVQAMLWFKKAADQGFAPAYTQLARSYANAQGVPQDDVTAIALFRRAAEQGDAGGEFSLGAIYFNGIGVAQSDVLALEWYRKAANQGMEEAKDRVALIEQIQSLAGRITDSTSSARAVRVVPDPGGRIDAPQHTFITGDRIPVRNINTLLFSSEPCPLPLVDAKNMRRAWMAYGAYQLGCWFPTVDDAYVFVGQIPSLTYTSELPWEGLPRAILYSDGSVRITEPNYDSKTFMMRVVRTKSSKIIDHLNERP